MPKGKYPRTMSEVLAQLEEKRVELFAAIAVEKRKEKQRAILRRTLARLTLLTQADAAKIVRQSKGNVRAAAPATSDRAGLLRADKKLKPAKGKIGKAIRAARIKAKLTTTALGEELGGSSGAVSKLESGGAIPSPAKRAVLVRLMPELGKVLPHANGAAA
jgi:DNA-binding transcriptional regulator YiaG